jgi:hypothetical protein
MLDPVNSFGGDLRSPRLEFTRQREKAIVSRNVILPLRGIVEPLPRVLHLPRED